MRLLRTVYWACRAMWWSLRLQLSGLPRDAVATEIRLRLEERGLRPAPPPERVGAPGFLLKKGPRDINMGPPGVFLTYDEMEEYWQLWSAVTRAHGGVVSDGRGRRVLRVPLRVVAMAEGRGRPWPCGKCEPCRAVLAFDKAHADAFS